MRRDASDILAAISVPMHWYDSMLPPPLFAPDIETEYRLRWRLSPGLRLQWFFVGFASLIYLGTLLAASLGSGGFAGGHVTGSLAMFGLGIVLSLATLHPVLGSRADYLVFMLLLVNVCVLTAFTLLTAQPGDGHARLSPLLVLMPLLYAFLLMGLPYRVCVPVGALLATADLAIAIGEGPSAFELWNHIVILGYLMLTGVITCSILERGDRRAWIRARLMQTRSESDPLTDLRNRRFLFEEGAYRIAHAVGAELPVALLMVDVDFFKQYNDTFGHPAGDRCLRLLSDTMMLGAHNALDITARLGGEEFAALLFGCDTASALKAAEALRNRIELLAIPHPNVPDGFVTVSVGVATVDSIGAGDLEGLLLAADLALYRAKKSGRNFVCYGTLSAPFRG